MSKPPQQFPLALTLDDTATFANFWSAADAQLLRQLKQLIAGDKGGWLYIAGASGSGVSHLLQASSVAAGERGLTSIYISLNELTRAYDQQHPEKLFESLELFDLLCIDDIEALGQWPVWQEPLFYLLEKLKNNSASRLVIGGKRVATQLDLTLADLQSRLAWATGFQMAELSDSQKASLLQFKSKRLGLAMPDDVARFIIHRCSRDTNHLVEILSTLDKQAMISRRRLTIPMVKEVLGL